MERSAPSHADEPQSNYPGLVAVDHAKGAVVGRAAIGPAGWLEIVSTAVGPGSSIFVTSAAGHRSHAVTA